MKLAWIALAAASLAAIFGVGLMGISGKSQTHSANPGAKPVVIVELFTSEGCSSCPPADRLLKKLSEEQSIEGAQVVALEEHVDYWNRLGWTDPFSSIDFSVRQEEYSRVFHNDTVYTPQMIVDGQTEFAGSQARKAREAIERAAGIPKVNVEVSPTVNEAEGVVTVDVRVVSASSANPNKEALELWLAVTEKGLQSDVKSGENSGETLKHAAVVRLLRKIEEPGSGGANRSDAGSDGSLAKHVTLKLKKDWNREQLSVVVFVVEKNSRKIDGAAIAPL